MMVTLWTGSEFFSEQLGHEGVTGLVPGRGLLLFVADDHAAALGPHQDLVLGHLEVDHGDHVLVLPGGEQRGLVHEVLEVGADEAGRAAGDDLEVDVGAEGHLLGVHAEDALAAAHVGAVDHDAPIEAAGRRIAGSSTSGRLVAAMMITPSFDSKPSISTRSWFSVCSRSS
jgi:hypothetical protein